MFLAVPFMFVFLILLVKKGEREDGDGVERERKRGNKEERVWFCYGDARVLGGAK